MDTVQSQESLVAQSVKRIALTAVITRADGTTEDLGTVAEYHRDPETQTEALNQGIGIITLCE